MGKRIVFGVLISLLSVTLLVAAYVLGTMANREDVTVIRSFDEEFQFVQAIQRPEGSDQIAVVNLDIGVELPSGEHFYHGVRAIRFPFDNFQMTSLGEARAGLEDNRFGAYVIVPANFSENVESLNARPTRIHIEYRLSSLLSGEEQKELLYAVLRFGDMLNADLSYMYLSSVLREFHEVQDYSLQLMEHDQLTAESIAAIEPGDLVEMIRLPDLIRTEHNVPPLDVAENINLIGQVLIDLSDAYQGKIELNNEQLALLTSQGLIISQELNRLISEVGAIDILHDEDGNPILSVGQTALVDLLTRFNDDVLGLQLMGMDGALALVLIQSDYFREALERSVDVHLDNLSDLIELFPDPMPYLMAVQNASGGYNILGNDGQLLLSFNLIPESVYIDPGYQQALTEVMGVLLGDFDRTVGDALALVDEAEIFSLSGLTLDQLLASISNIPIEIQEAEIDKVGDIENVNDYMLDPFREFEEELTIENLRYRPYYFDEDGVQERDENDVELTLEDLLDQFNDFVRDIIILLGDSVKECRGQPKNGYT